MRTLRQGLEEPVLPTLHEVERAEASSRVLAQHLPSQPADVQLRSAVREGDVQDIDRF